MPTELDIARDIRDGKLSSPQRVGSMMLVALRITGTGAAYRPSLKEYVWRDPSHYLNEDTLERCQGLPVVWKHQTTNEPLDSEEFAKRVIGTVMLPYVRGDEVWGVSRIYDDFAIEALEKQPLSTSPMVVTSGGAKFVMNDGKHVLMEGAPSLIDSVAVLPDTPGVWDKGSGMNGVAQEARADAVDVLNVRIDELKRQVHEVEKRMPTRNPADQRENFRTARLKWDQIAQAFGDPEGVRGPLNGESLGDYQRALANPHKDHSRWKDIDLYQQVPDAMLDVVVEQIHADALTAAKNPPVTPGTLTPRYRKDAAGRLITEWVGDINVMLDPFRNPRRYVTRFITGGR